MKLNLIPVLLAGLLSAAPAFSATPVTIDFEGPTSYASIDQYYNGGADSAGAVGVNLGVTFGLDALAFQHDLLSFSNAPSPVGVMAPVNSDAALNYAAGFTTGAMFYYSSANATSVGVYDGLNGTGNLLGTFSLASNDDSSYSNWSLATLTFNGTAKSIAFGQAASALTGFDNVTIGAVPEPTEALMLALGLGVVAQVVQRARRKQASV